jgi:hypothetical protein
MVRHHGLGGASLSLLVLLSCDSGGNSARDGGASGGSDGGTSSSATPSSGAASSSGSTGGSAGGPGASSSGSGSGSSAGSNGPANGGPGGGADASSSNPAVAISAPASGAAVTTTTGDVPISFTTTSFALVSPGDSTCLDASNNCGHVHLFVDGTACTPSGQPYNNDGQASPISARLTSCAAVAGSHRVQLQLHHNDHSPVVVGGSIVSASVTFTAM